MDMTTDEQIDAAILAAITNTPAELHTWAAVQKQVPGSRDRKSGRLIALWHQGRVWLVRIAGKNYLTLGDPDDRRQAVADRARTPRAI